MSIQEEIQKTEEAKRFVIESGLVTDSVIKIYDNKLARLKSQLPIIEKKNDTSESNQSSGIIADATNAVAKPQYSTTNESARNNLDVAANPIADIDNSLLNSKWVGKVSRDKFLTQQGFELFMSVKGKLKQLITNWLKLETPNGEDVKKNKAIDLSNELIRIVKNEVKDQFKEEVYSIKFFVSDGKNKIFYGCDETLIDNIFKIK